MKKIMTATLGMLAFASIASADEYVNGYFRKDGTYVQPHYRSSPNSTKMDNYSSQGNVNPYTGERGSQRNEYSNPPAYNNPYGSTYKYNNPYRNTYKSYGK